MAKSPRKTTETKPAPRKRAPKKLDMEKLKRLTAEIAEYQGADQTNLIHRLETEEGMKLAERPKGSGTYVIALAGLKASSTGGAHAALTNWGNAARRKLSGAG